MGFLESGSVYLHTMRRHPQEPGSTYIQSKVSQPGPVDLRTNPGTACLQLYLDELFFVIKKYFFKKPKNLGCFKPLIKERYFLLNVRGLNFTITSSLSFNYTKWM